MRTPDIADCITKTCPWVGKPVQAESLTDHHGDVVVLCNLGSRDRFNKAVRYSLKPSASQAGR